MIWSRFFGFLGRYLDVIGQTFFDKKKVFVKLRRKCKHDQEAEAEQLNESEEEEVDTMRSDLVEVFQFLGSYRDVIGQTFLDK